MSRKDYEAIAFVLRVQHDSYEDGAVQHGDPESMAAAIATRETARMLADVFAQDNPRFDRETFLKACGVSA